MYYLLYWAIVLSIMIWKWYTGTLTDRRQVRTASPPTDVWPVPVGSGLPWYW